MSDLQPLSIQPSQGRVKLSFSLTPCLVRLDEGFHCAARPRWHCATQWTLSGQKPEIRAKHVAHTSGVRGRNSPLLYMLFLLWAPSQGSHGSITSPSFFFSHKLLTSLYLGRIFVPFTVHSPPGFFFFYCSLVTESAIEKQNWFVCILKTPRSTKWKWYMTHSVEIHFSFDILRYTTSLWSSIEIIRQITA